MIVPLKSDRKLKFRKATHVIEEVPTPRGLEVKVIPLMPVESMKEAVVVPPPQPRDVVERTTITEHHDESLLKNDTQGFWKQGLPTLHCSVCQIGPECPEYAEGFVCAFDKHFRNTPIQSLQDIVVQTGKVFQDNLLRLQRARLHEDLTLGGAITTDVTMLSETVVNQAQVLSNLIKNSKVVVQRAEGGGLLKALLGDMMRKDEAPAQDRPRIEEVTQADGSVIELGPPDPKAALLRQRGP